MRRVIWSKPAVRQVRDTAVFIAQDDKAASISVVGRIEKAAESLGRYSTGRPGRLPGSFEKLVPGLPYIVVYSLSDSVVTILRVIHTAQHFPPR